MNVEPLYRLPVSVVVPTCRRPELLARCLSALVKQSLDPSAYEIIVVDDAGCEHTRRLVEGWTELRLAYTYVLEPERESALSPSPWRSPGAGAVEAAPALLPAMPAVAASWAQASSQARGALVGVKGLPPLRYLSTGGGRGPAAARNLGWRAARGEVIAFTDDDCLPAPSWLEQGLLALQAGAAGACGRTLVPLPSRPSDYERDVAGLERSLFITANCFYRRSALASVGGFDERFPLAWREDSDLFFSLLERGAGLARAPGAVVVHPIRPAPWGVSLRQQRRSLYNALLYKKHPESYRCWLQSGPPWGYYLTLLSLLAALVGLLAGRGALALCGAGAWLALTLRFACLRQRGAARTLRHVLEMLVTSALIPPLSIYWRLRGAIKYRVLFF